MAIIGVGCGEFTTKRIVRTLYVQILSLRPPAEVRFFRSHQNTFKNKFLKRLERIYLLSLSESRRIIDATKMASLIVEIRKIGVNINQIASVANTQKYVNKEMQTKINKHQEKILDLLQKILEEVYDTEEHSFKKMERTLESLEKKIDKQTKKIERLERNSSS